MKPWSDNDQKIWIVTCDYGDGKSAIYAALPVMGCRRKRCCAFTDQQCVLWLQLHRFRLASRALIGRQPRPYPT